MEKTKVRQLIKVGCGVDVMQLIKGLLELKLFDNKYIGIINEVL